MIFLAKYGKVYFIVCFLFNLILKKVFWNADKPIYQKRIADKVANIFNENNLLTDIHLYDLWIKNFIQEFIKKWTKIDFLRLDKYIMLTQTVLNNYFDFNLKNQLFSQILKVFDFISDCVDSRQYNFGFISNIIKIITKFLTDILGNTPPNDLTVKFVDNYLSELIDKYLSIFLVVKDKREINSFAENIFPKILEKFGTYSDNDMIVKHKDSVIKKLFSLAKSK